MITAAGAQQAEQVLRSGGVILFGADTVYGLACAHDNPDAQARIAALKRRDPAQPSALLAFSLAAAEPLLEPLGPATRRAVDALLPGPVTLVLPGGGGLRVPALVPQATALASVGTLVVQSSANLTGQPAPASLGEVAPELLAAADLVLDSGPLGGQASTVVDLTGYEHGGRWSVLREGAMAREQVAAALG